MNEHRRSVIQVLAALLIAEVLIIGLTCVALSKLKSNQNEIVEWSDWIYLNGVRYDPDYQLNNYHVSDVLICKTKSGGKAYEIEEFPDHQYIALYYAWDGTIYKRTGERLEDYGT